MNLRRKLLAAQAVGPVLVFLITAVFFLAVRQVERDFNEFARHEFGVSSALTNLRFASLSIVATTNELHLLGLQGQGGTDLSEDVARERSQLAEAVGEYEGALVQLGALRRKNVPFEFQYLDQIEKLGRRLLSVSEEIAILSGRVPDGDALAERREELESLEITLLGAATDALEAQVQQAALRRQEVERTFQRAVLAGIGAGGLCLLVMFLFHRSIANSIQGSLRTLAVAASRIGRGEYDVRIGVDSRDEIGQLAESFRAMAKDLKNTDQERLAAESELRAAKHEAELANRVKTDFIANVSHELRTPLNAVIGFSEMMQSGIYGPLGDQRYGDYVNDIHSSGEHLLKLINDVLDVAKIESGTMELHEEIIDVRGVVIASAGMAVRGAGSSCSNIVEIVPECLPGLYADERKIKQIVINLLSNATKFTPQDGEVRLEVSCDPERGYMLRIGDNGIGISPQDLPKVLAPFGQVENDWGRSYEGTGLGLPLTKSLVDMHGGTMEIESKLGAGTTVTVRFPADRTVNREMSAA